MRQVAIDAASIPKDAKIAFLEKNSAESEKMIAEARSDKLKQLAEIQQSQRRVADLEGKVKSLEASLAEKSALVKVMHKRGYDKTPDVENILSIPILDNIPTPTSHVLHSKQVLTNFTHNESTCLG